MSTPEATPSMARGDDDAAVNTAADRIRERLERRGIRPQDVDDALRRRARHPSVTRDCALTSASRPQA